ncbi:MAG TPA: BTAD domain-containing putative transcriptional regulator [Gemmatimonadales bacterium]|nr:BTAD domain-containing putative transcriptional regulator [Gemmatimonadales bacterium]
MITFKALGAIALHGPHGPADKLLAQPKRLALLSWLALASPRGPHRRDRLLALFWPESDEGRARNSLSQAIYHLRQELEPELFVGRGAETLGLDFARLDCDVLAFEQAAAAGRWLEVRTRYQGDLLPSFHVSGALEFERWLERERQRLAGIAVDAGWRAATDAERRGEAAEAAEAARWAAGLLPYDEEALRRLLGVLDRAGDRAGLLEAYESFAQRLGQEFGERPGPETAALVAQVRSRPLAAYEVDRSAHDGPSVPATAPSERVPTPAAARRSRVPLGLAVAGALLLVLTLVAIARRSAEADLLPVRRAVAVMPFTVHGEPSLAYVGDGIGALLEAKLDGAGGTRLVDPRAVRGLLAPRSGDTGDAGLTLEAARRLRATHFVTGDVTAVGDRVQVRAELRSAAGSGDVLKAAAVSGARDSLFALADAVALQLLPDVAGLGRRESQAAGAAGTTSLDAFRAFLDGEAAMAAGRYAEAADRFAGAVAFDSGFAIAAYRGATALDWASHSGQEILAMLALADRGRARLSIRQTRLLDAATAYYRQDGDAAEHVLAEMVADDPEAIEAWFLLGETRFHLGPARGRSWREARVPFERVAALDPDDLEALLHLARLAAADRDRPRLEALAAAVLPRLRGTVRGWELEGLRAYVSGDQARIADFRRGLASAPPGAAQEAARALAVYLEEVEVALGVDRLGAPGRSGALRTPYLVALGRWQEALDGPVVPGCERPTGWFCPELRLALASLPGVPLSNERSEAWRVEVENIVTLGDDASRHRNVARFAMLGRFAAAQGDGTRWAEAKRRLDSLVSPDTFAAAYGAWLDAVWLARQGGAVTAVDGARAILRDPARRHSLLGPEPSWPARLDLAMALAAAGRDEEALALFRSVPDASGRDLMFLPYARLGEARLLARRGQLAAARRSFGDVLRLWRHADPAFQPMVAAARADSARVGR